MPLALDHDTSRSHHVIREPRSLHETPHNRLAMMRLPRHPLPQVVGQHVVSRVLRLTTRRVRVSQFPTLSGNVTGKWKSLRLLPFFLASQDRRDEGAMGPHLANLMPFKFVLFFSCAVFDLTTGPSPERIRLWAKQTFDFSS